MKIKWKIISLRAAMRITSYVDGNIIAATSFIIPECIIWGVGFKDSQKVAETISKRIKVKRVI